MTTNTWHCAVCNFDVFNSKAKCSKCLTQKPTSKVTPHTRFFLSPFMDSKAESIYENADIISQANKLKGKITSYDPNFDKSICNFFTEQLINEKTICGRCKAEADNGSIKSTHNCWKYT